MDPEQNKSELPADLVEALAELRNSTAKTASDKVLCALAGSAWPVPEKKAPAAAQPPAPAPAT